MDPVTLPLPNPITAVALMACSTAAALRGHTYVRLVRVRGAVETCRTYSLAHFAAKQGETSLNATVNTVQDFKPTYWYSIPDFNVQHRKGFAPGGAEPNPDL